MVLRYLAESFLVKYFVIVILNVFNINNFFGYLRYILSNGHSRHIRETRPLLERICRGESHFSQKWPLGNVGESGEYSVNGLANVGESGKYSVNGLANVGESRKYMIR